MTKQFIIVDDHPVFRRGLAALIQTEKDYHVLAESSSIEDVMEVLRNKTPDILIVDISLKNQNGLILVKMLQDREPRFPILVISMHDEAVYAERAVKAGALGYVMKHAPPEVIMEAVHTVLSGRIYLSSAIQKRILEDRFNQPQGRSPLIDRLSERELQILQFIGQGFGASEIADMLNLSVKTIYTYRDHLKDKLQIESSKEVRRFAIKWSQSINTDGEGR